MRLPPLRGTAHLCIRKKWIMLRTGEGAVQDDPPLERAEYSKDGSRRTKNEAVIQPSPVMTGSFRNECKSGSRLRVPQGCRGWAKDVYIGTGVHEEIEAWHEPQLKKRTLCVPSIDSYDGGAALKEALLSRGVHPAAVEGWTYYQATERLAIVGAVQSLESAAPRKVRHIRMASCSLHLIEGICVHVTGFQRGGRYMAGVARIGCGGREGAARVVRRCGTAAALHSLFPAARWQMSYPPNC